MNVLGIVCDRNMFVRRGRSVMIVSGLKPGSINTLYIQVVSDIKWFIVGFFKNRY